MILQFPVTRTLSLLIGFAVTGLGLACWPGSATADPTIHWTVDGAPVVTANRDQRNPSVTTDGHGGLIAAWQDYRRYDTTLCPTNQLLCSVDIYAQRLNREGQPQWGVHGVPVSTVNGWKVLPSILGDGQDGAFIVWQDRRNGNYDIYAQHLNADGQPLWTLGGIPIAVATRDQFSPSLVSDGNGGVIMAWVAQRRYIAYYVETDIFAQRVTANGQVLWAQNGVPVTIASGIQSALHMLDDGQGGAFVAYIDNRSSYYGSTTGQDIFAQHINSAGQLLWNSDGVPVCNAASHQSFSTMGNSGQATDMISDGAGGVILAWWDMRNPSGLPDIYTQRMNAAGQPLWTNNGVPVSQAVGGQWAPQLTTDGAGGAIIVWDDRRKGIWAVGDDAGDVYAQHISAAGQPLWAQDGQAVTLLPNSQGIPAVVSDGHGGAIVAWQSYLALSDTNIHAQRLNGEGHVLWAVDGIPISLAAYFQYNPLLLGDGDGGAIIVWEDRRTGLAPAGHYDIYAQRISDAPPANHPPEFDAVSPPSVLEGQTLNLVITAHDADDDPLLLTASSLPAFAVFTDQGNGHGLLTVTPGYDAAGLYTIEFMADDGHSTASLSVQLTVVNVNRPPVFVGLTAQQIAECSTLTLPVSAVDPDGDPITIGAGPLPDGATFIDQTFRWTPTAQQAGSYTVQLTAGDGQLTTQFPLLITVAQTPYGFSGFLPPLSETSPNIAKLGSTVPVKFRLSSCGPDLTAHATVWVQPFVDGRPAGPRQPGQATDQATTGNIIKNTDIAKLFHYNLKTSVLSKGAWQVQVDLDDGTIHAVILTLK